MSFRVAIRRASQLAVIALAAMMLVGCGGGGEEEAPPAQPPTLVEAVAVSTDKVVDELTSVGTIKPNEVVTIKPEAAGIIRAIHFEEGKRVKEGDLLFELDNQKEKAQLEEVKAELELAKQNLQRSKPLVGTKAISQQEVDQLASQVALKQAALTYQEERLSDTRIHAPITGRLGPREVSLGQYVNIGDTLVTLTDDLKVKISYRASEKYAGRVEEGQKVSLTVAAHGEEKFAGEVDLINPMVDQNTRTLEIRALVPNEDGRLKPGMFAHVRTVIGERDGSIVVPERAVIPSLTGFAVYLIKDGQATLTPVQLGMRMPGKVEVKSGLEVGQELITSGNQKIADGAPVTTGDAAAEPAAEAAANSAE